MKISIDLELTPDELRKLFGLPDVEEFQRQLMNQLRERMLSGAEGYDPVRLFQPYVAGSMASWDLFQKMLGRVTAMSGTGAGEAPTDRA